VKVLLEEEVGQAVVERAVLLVATLPAVIEDLE